MNSFDSPLKTLQRKPVTRICSGHQDIRTILEGLLLPSEKNKESYSSPLNSTQKYLRTASLAAGDFSRRHVLEFHGSSHMVMHTYELFLLTRHSSGSSPISDTQECHVKF